MFLYLLIHCASKFLYNFKSRVYCSHIDIQNDFIMENDVTNKTTDLEIIHYKPYINDNSIEETNNQILAEIHKNMIRRELINILQSVHVHEANKLEHLKKNNHIFDNNNAKYSASNLIAAGLFNDFNFNILE